jgi:deoxyribodipyrimidine photo-lyase
MPVPPLRIQVLNDAPLRPLGRYVLYWMIAQRRTTWNFGLQRAVELSAESKKPLLVFEALRIGYPWASERLHRFVIEGMIDNSAACKSAGVAHYPYVEPAAGDGSGLLEALARHACAVVTDDFPCFFLPQMVQAAAKRLDVRLEAVDANGILPMRAANNVFVRAFDFRRWLQRNLRPHLEEFPLKTPLENCSGKRAAIPDQILARWPAADLQKLSSEKGLADFEINHSVLPGPIAGGAQAADVQLRQFVRRRLSTYPEQRDDPDDDAGSGLSPYLHFGHVSAHQILQSVAKHEGWKRTDISGDATGKNTGWWGGSPALEAFFDQLVTWRELGFNMCWQRRDYDRYESLPAWARKTLQKHAKDKREATYSLEQLAAADTYDEIWNAAQRQLVREGRMHNYLRMLWGKKILEWSPDPRTALAHLIELNNRYALDGRDPNSYSGIFWILGRYDRAWGPERPIFGTVRYMSSESARKKLRLKKYLAKYART